MGKVVGEGILLLMFLTHTTSYIVHPLQTNGLNEVEAQRSQDGPYAFGYEVEDPHTNNVQFKNEERHENGTVTGSYGYLQPDGNVQKVSYVADKFGYRASVQIVPRGVLKPIQLFRPETHLLDFSSNPVLQKPIQQTMTKDADPIVKFSKLSQPYDVPNYFNKRLERPKYRMERGFVPYFPQKYKTADLYQNLVKDRYVLPLQ